MSNVKMAKNIFKDFLYRRGLYYDNSEDYKKLKPIWCSNDKWNKCEKLCKKCCVKTIIKYYS